MTPTTAPPTPDVPIPPTQPPPRTGEVMLAPRPPLREMLTTLKDTGAELVATFAAEIVRREIAATIYGQDQSLARIFALSGEFVALKNLDRDQAINSAMTRIQLGRSWNMEPADSMQSIYFINGRPSVGTDYLAAKIYDSGVAWDIAWHRDANDVCIGCSLHLTRYNPESRKHEPIMERVNNEQRQAVVSFKKADADRAKISENGSWISLSEKWNFVSWPDDMYFARCVSRVRKRYVPNVLSGTLSKDEAEDLPPVEIQRALPAATETKKLVLTEAVTPAKGAKKQAGAATIPGASTATAPQQAEPKTEQDEPNPGKEEPQAKQEPVAAKEEPAPTKEAPKQDPPAGNVSTFAEQKLGPSAPVQSSLLAQEAAAVSGAPVSTKDAAMAELMKLRDLADSQGDGLFRTWMKEVNPDITSAKAFGEMPEAELVQHVEWLKLRAAKKWRQNRQSGEWKAIQF